MMWWAHSFFESNSLSVQFGFDFFGSISWSKTLINHIMLKTIQILGCSSGLVSHRWKPQASCCSLSFISAVSTKPLSSSSSSSRSLPTTKDLVFPGPSTRRTRFGAFSMSSAHSGSNPGGPSSSSSSSLSSSTVVVQSVGNALLSLPNLLLSFSTPFWILYIHSSQAQTEYPLQY